jgi:hypothetical protein
MRNRKALSHEVGKIDLRSSVCACLAGVLRRVFIAVLPLNDFFRSENCFQSDR